MSVDQGNSKMYLKSNTNFPFWQSLKMGLHIILCNKTETIGKTGGLASQKEAISIEYAAK